jgi:hypothetical protein
MARSIAHSSVSRTIRGELLKLGFSVAKYMVKRRSSPSQRWRTFLRKHTPDIAAMDLLVVPTMVFDLLYAIVIVRRRPEPCLDQRHSKSHCGMNCTLDHGCISSG